MTNLVRVNNKPISKNKVQNKSNISRANVLEDILSLPTQNVFGNVATKDCNLVQNNIVNNVYGHNDHENEPQLMLPPSKPSAVSEFFGAIGTISRWALGTFILLVLGAIIYGFINGNGFHS